MAINKPQVQRPEDYLGNVLEPGAAQAPGTPDPRMDQILQQVFPQQFAAATGAGGVRTTPGGTVAASRGAPAVGPTPQDTTPVAAAPQAAQPELGDLGNIMSRAMNAQSAEEFKDAKSSLHTFAAENRIEASQGGDMLAQEQGVQQQQGEVTSPRDPTQQQPMLDTQPTTQGERLTQMAGQGQGVAQLAGRNLPKVIGGPTKEPTTKKGNSDAWDNTLYGIGQGLKWAWNSVTAGFPLPGVEDQYRITKSPSRKRRERAQDAAGTIPPAHMPISSLYGFGTGPLDTRGGLPFRSAVHGRQQAIGNVTEIQRRFDYDPNFELDREIKDTDHNSWYRYLPLHSPDAWWSGKREIYDRPSDEMSKEKTDAKLESLAYKYPRDIGRQRAEFREWQRSRMSLNEEMTRVRSESPTGDIVEFHDGFDDQGLPRWARYLVRPTDRRSLIDWGVRFLRRMPVRGGVPSGAEGDDPYSVLPPEDNFVIPGSIRREIDEHTGRSGPPMPATPWDLVRYWNAFGVPNRYIPGLLQASLSIVFKDKGFRRPDTWQKAQLDPYYHTRVAANSKETGSAFRSVHQLPVEKGKKQTWTKRGYAEAAKVMGDPIVYRAGNFLDDDPWTVWNPQAASWQTSSSTGAVGSSGELYGKYPTAKHGYSIFHGGMGFSPYGHMRRSRPITAGIGGALMPEVPAFGPAEDRPEHIYKPLGASPDDPRQNILKYNRGEEQTEEELPDVPVIGSATDPATTSPEVVMMGGGGEWLGKAAKAIGRVLSGTIKPAWQTAKKTPKGVGSMLSTAKRFALGQRLGGQQDEIIELTGAMKGRVAIRLGGQQGTKLRGGGGLRADIPSKSSQGAWYPRQGSIFHPSQIEEYGGRIVTLTADDLGIATSKLKGAKLQKLKARVGEKWITFPKSQESLLMHKVNAAGFRLPKWWRADQHVANEISSLYTGGKRGAIKSLAKRGGAIVGAGQGIRAGVWPEEVQMAEQEEPYHAGSSRASFDRIRMDIWVEGLRTMLETVNMEAEQDGVPEPFPNLRNWNYEVPTVPSEVPVELPSTPKPEGAPMPNKAPDNKVKGQ